MSERSGEENLEIKSAFAPSIRSSPNQALRTQRSVSDAREYRLRIVCFLPSNNEQQATAVHKFVEYLKNPINNDIPVGGFTVSDPLWPMWIGHWYSPEKRQWVEDRIVLCLIDLQLAQGAAVAPVSLIHLKRVIACMYRDCAGAEEEIWITAQQIFRHE